MWCGQLFNSLFPDNAAVGPTVVSLSPAHQTETVPSCTTELVVEFSARIRLTRGAVLVTRLNDDAVQSIAAGDLIVSGTKLRIPVEALGAGKGYSVSIPYGLVTNEFGRVYTGLSSGSWTFASQGMPTCNVVDLGVGAV